MSNNVHNVLSFNKAKERECYRAAVKQIILDVQYKYNITLQDISDATDISIGTIINAAGEKCDLSPTLLKRIGQCFGPEMLNLYVGLFGGRIVPLQPSEVDPMPALAGLLHAICKARAEGTERDHRVKLAMLPELKAAQAAITNMVLHAEELRA